MLRALLAAVVLPTALAAQLPMIATPHRLLRFELHGNFNPSNEVWRDGHRMPIGDLQSGTLTGLNTPLLSDMDRQLAVALGSAPSGNSLGSIRSVVQWQRNVGTFSVAWGATPRLTLRAAVPLVSVRTERQTSYDPTGASVGFNPSHPVFGDGLGQNQTAAFLTSLDASLEILAGRIAEGAYAGEQRTLAETTLTDATALRGAIGQLTGTGLLLPLAGSPDGVALETRLTALATTLGAELGVNPFVSRPALPSTALTSEGFNTLVGSPVGLGLRPGTGQPTTTMGRLELGAILELSRRATEEDSATMRLWGRAVARIGTGTDPNPTTLLALGTGGRNHEVELGGTVDVHRGTRGLRGDLALTVPIKATGTRRLAGIDEMLPPASRQLFSSWAPGPGIKLTAEPWTVLTPHLTLSGRLGYDRRADDRLEIPGLDTSIGVDPAAIVRGTGHGIVTLGFGLTYLHDGLHHDGARQMPVEAGFAIERTIRASGFAPAELTSRVFIRFYRR